MDSRRAREVVSELKTELVRIYGDRLRGVYLYGSYARNEQHEESDLDVLIVLDSVPRYGDEIERTSEAIGSFSRRYGVTLSRVFVSESDWIRGENPFVLVAKAESLAA